jgi:hypothetical protein
MNEGIHQGLIGGVDSADDVCLYKAFRIARKELQEFKEGLKRESLPVWFPRPSVVSQLILGAWRPSTNRLLLNLKGPYR